MLRRIWFHLNCRRARQFLEEEAAAGGWERGGGASGLTLFSEIQQDDVSKYRDEGYRYSPLRGWISLSLSLSPSSGWERLLMWLHCSWNWFGNRLSPAFRLIRSGIKLRAQISPPATYRSSCLCRSINYSISNSGTLIPMHLDVSCLLSISINHATFILFLSVSGKCLLFVCITHGPRLWKSSGGE